MTHLGRPDVVVEPVHQREIVGQPAQQRHRGMSVQVDEPGDQRMPGQRDVLRGAEFGARFSRRQYCSDAPMVDNDCVIEKHTACRLNWDYPACFQDGVDGLEGWIHPSSLSDLTRLSSSAILYGRFCIRSLSGLIPTNSYSIQKKALPEQGFFRSG